MILEARIAKEIMRHTGVGQTTGKSWICKAPEQSTLPMMNVPKYITDSNSWDVLVDKLAGMNMSVTEHTFKPNESFSGGHEVEIFSYDDDAGFEAVAKTRTEARTKAIEELLTYLGKEHE